MVLGSYSLSSCIFLLAVVELLNNYSPFLVFLRGQKLKIQLFFFLWALHILLALFGLSKIRAMLIISSHAELLRTLMQEDCSLSFALWKYCVDGRCVESISAAFCFSSDSLSFLEVMCVTGGPDLEGMGGVSEWA